MPQISVKWIVAGVIGFIVLVLTPVGCRVVPAGFVGVKTRFGHADAIELNPGLHFIVPFVDSLWKVDTRLIPFTTDASAASRDLQRVTTQVTIAHHLTPEMASETFQRIGMLPELDKAVVGPGIQESVKAVTAKYTAEELITKRQQVKLQIELDIKAYLAKSLEEAGLTGAINVNSVAVTDFKFSPEFDASIEAKVKAEQEALKAENEKKTRITQAEAEAESKKRQAEAEAYKTLKEAEARASAIRVEGDALKNNPALLTLRAIERWKGNVPNITTGNNQSVIPFVNVDLKEAK